MEKKSDEPSPDQEQNGTWSFFSTEEKEKESRLIEGKGLLVNLSVINYLVKLSRRRGVFAKVRRYVLTTAHAFLFPGTFQGKRRCGLEQECFSWARDYVIFGSALN
jgi:hypothetical protein